MSKITRYEDIPMFTREGSWECDYPLHYAVVTIRKWADEDGLILDPDFQRAHVWTEEQQIAWIEFFLRGGKTGRVIYFNHPGWMRNWKGEFVVVDGKQRLRAIMRFFDNEIPAFGTLYRDFEDNPRMIRNTIKFNVNDLKTRAEVLQWYIDFNAGGTPHSEEEIDRVRELLEREARKP